jgi:hypothetical protein
VKFKNASGIDPRLKIEEHSDLDPERIISVFATLDSATQSAPEP